MRGTPTSAENLPFEGPNEPAVNDRIHVPIKSDVDIVRARQLGRGTAAKTGFSSTDQSLIATAISELARNIVLYAKQGEIIIEQIENTGKWGIRVVARDEGPGIRNVEQALQVGYSTSGGLGLGLPGVRRLMDGFDIKSTRGRGTTVTIRKWKP
jgi:serine/threonine-protein kinase RsbT